MFRPMMSDRDQLLEEVRRYCAASGISASTLAVRALDNSRFFDRLERRIEREAEEARRLRAYMKSNPPRGGDAAQSEAAA